MLLHNYFFLIFLLTWDISDYAFSYDQILLFILRSTSINQQKSNSDQRLNEWQKPKTEEADC